MIAKRKRFKKIPHQNIFFSTLLLILVLLIIGFLIVSNRRISQRRGELTSQINRLKREIQILEEKKQQLMSSISQGSEETYLEKEARERLGLKKPGEEVVVIKRENPPGAREKTKESFWERASASFSPIREKATDFWENLKFW